MSGFGFLVGVIRFGGSSTSIGSGVWILEAGSWADSGSWIDTEVWNDT
jgi:hypothetical protein